MVDLQPPVKQSERYYRASRKTWETLVVSVILMINLLVPAIGEGPPAVKDHLGIQYCISWVDTIRLQLDTLSRIYNRKSVGYGLKANAADLVESCISITGAVVVAGYGANQISSRKAVWALSFTSAVPLITKAVNAWGVRWKPKQETYRGLALKASSLSDSLKYELARIIYSDLDSTEMAKKAWVLLFAANKRLNEIQEKDQDALPLKMYPAMWKRPPILKPEMF